MNLKASSHPELKYPACFDSNTGNTRLVFKLHLVEYHELVPSDVVDVADDGTGDVVLAWDNPTDNILILLNDTAHSEDKANEQEGCHKYIFFNFLL